MEKKKISKRIFHKTQDKPFKWSDLKHIQFEDDDELEISYNEAYYGSDSAMDAHYSATIQRDVLETDEEFNKRKQRIENVKELGKKIRYENYLKLKKEFESQ